MIDISSFVLRWMFLSNLCRDITDIQTLPSIHNHNHHYHNNILPSQPPSIQPSTNSHNAYTSSNDDYYHSQQQQQSLPNNNRSPLMNVVDHPTAYSSDQRIIKSSSVHHSDPVQQSHERQSQPLYHPHYYQQLQQQQQQQQHNQHVQHTSSPQLHRSKLHKTTHREEEAEYKEQCWREILSYPSNCIERNMVINHLRADLVQQLQYRIQHDTQIVQQYNRNNNNTITSDHRNTNTPLQDNNTKKNNETSSAPTLNDYIIAKRSLLLFRNYLPQLVALILKSPPPLSIGTSSSTTTTSNIVQEENVFTTTTMSMNPIHQLRHIVLSQCVHDASIGIELCWLLEAEVGRAWKTLFEHRLPQQQQQGGGRRLIIVMPADKAIVLAKIGIEKREAFDLLQDVEQATAFGYTESSMELENNMPVASEMEQQHPTSRLPSSLSVRRCSHFGDTMHFIDRLSKISSDLRMVPTQYRYNVLHDQLHELNRRLRRRMVSRGDISLDVDDNRSPYDWPHIEDMSVDLISYSVHLPLIPQVREWCDGEVNVQIGNDNENAPPVQEIPKTEVVRVLNIVVHEARLLSSRERCPFLLHVEVADSGLEGSDARLYATGMSDIGSTIGEALGMMSTTSNVASSSTTTKYDQSQMTSRTPRNTVPYIIPDELLPHRHVPTNSEDIATNQHSDELTEKHAFIRGGSQNESPYFHDVISGEFMIDPFDLVRQQDYEQLQPSFAVTAII